MRCYIVLLALALVAFLAVESRSAFGELDSVTAAMIHRKHQLGLPPARNQRESLAVRSKYFDQLLDHFDETDTTTWKQQYQTNNEFWTSTDGPIFLMLGGEGPADIGWLTSGQWVVNARIYGALLIQLEHRYYGDSQPTTDLSVDNLKYLSSEQALADAAYFVEALIEENNLQNNKFIVFGGSYSGALVAWFRLKYPNIIHGAVASSAPVQAELDFVEYYEVVTQSLDYFAPGCSDVVSQATAAIESTLAETGGAETISTMFNLCETLDLSNANDVSTFYNSLAGEFAGVVQYNNPEALVNINTLCKPLLNTDLGTPIQRYAQLFNDVYGGSCIDVRYQLLIDFYSLTSYAVSGGARQWFYQTCNEFGFYQTTDGGSAQAFGDGFGIDYNTQQCTEVFGDAFTAATIQANVDNTNAYYGGRAIANATSNVVFPNGSIDPWHALSVLKGNPPNTTALFVEGTSHCYDMYNDAAGDPKEMIVARLDISLLIGDWLAQK